QFIEHKLFAIHIGSATCVRVVASPKILGIRSQQKHKLMVKHRVANDPRSDYRDRAYAGHEKFANRVRPQTSRGDGQVPNRNNVPRDKAPRPTINPKITNLFTVGRSTIRNAWSSASAKKAASKVSGCALVAL